MMTINSAESAFRNVVSRSHLWIIEFDPTHEPVKDLDVTVHRDVDVV